MRIGQFLLNDDGSPAVGPGPLPIPLLKDYPYTIGANMVTYTGVKPHLYVIYTPYPKICVLSGPVAHSDNVLRIELHSTQVSFDKLAYLIAASFNTVPRISIQNTIIQKGRLTSRKLRMGDPTIEEIKYLTTLRGVYQHPEILYFIDNPPYLPQAPKLFVPTLEGNGYNFRIREYSVTCYCEHLLIQWPDRHLCAKEGLLIYGGLESPIGIIDKIIPWIEPQKTTRALVEWLINVAFPPLLDVLLPLPTPIREQIDYYFPAPILSTSRRRTIKMTYK